MCLDPFGFDFNGDGDVDFYESYLTRRIREDAIGGEESFDDLSDEVLDDLDDFADEALDDLEDFPDEASDGSDESLDSFSDAGLESFGDDDFETFDDIWSDEL